MIMVLIAGEKWLRKDIANAKFNFVLSFPFPASADGHTFIGKLPFESDVANILRYTITR